MPLDPTPCERFLGGFYVGEGEHHDAIHQGRYVRYIIVLDSYADAVTWRRLMAGDDSFITPLSHAAGEAAKQLRSAIALADTQFTSTNPIEEEAGVGEFGIESIESEPLGVALEHLRTLLVRSPAYMDYSDLSAAVKKCAYCEADLTDDKHTDDCAWQGARRFLLEKALSL